MLYAFSKIDVVMMLPCSVYCICCCRCFQCSLYISFTECCQRLLHTWYEITNIIVFTKATGSAGIFKAYVEIHAVHIFYTPAHFSDQCTERYLGIKNGSKSAVKPACQDI